MDGLRKSMNVTEGSRNGINVAGKSVWMRKLSCVFLFHEEVAVDE